MLPTMYILYKALLLTFVAVARADSSMFSQIHWCDHGPSYVCWRLSGISNNMH
ncbi:hypothetical protein DPV78_006060 [Talaromyces pinophilus]|nr:hypothetical protein DPV78_006060 [Talaromyces pinophilus]